MQKQVLAHPLTIKAVNRLLENPVHAVGFYGDFGAGKAKLAEYAAKKFLEVDSLKNSPGFFEIDASVQGVGIENVRELQAYLSLKTPGKKNIKRVVLINEFSQFGVEAQNALLKVLEEAPLDTVILVSISQQSTVLETIHSRLAKIDVLPVDLASCLVWFGDKYNEKEVERYYYMSAGQAGLLQALLEQKTDHSLVKAINMARKILTDSRYRRLAQVDQLVKSKDVDLNDMLDGLYRLLDAHFKLSVSSEAYNDKKMQAIRRKMELVQNAINDLSSKVSAKLVLSRLFSEL